MREGYQRSATNNIIINNGLHPHVWYKNSGDVFKNNILFKSYQPAIMDKTIAKDGKWGKELDYNFYVANKVVMSRFSGNDCDKNSMNGDPLFIDPSKCDFRVQEGSHAFKTGFVNFPMDQFGVMKPSLKAIAKTPEIPAITIQIDEKNVTVSKPEYSWMNAQLKEPVGDELSAFGVSFDSGGVALTTVPENFVLSKLGFRSGDLIQEINECKIKNIQSLVEYMDTKKTVDRHQFVVIRNQAKIKITINQHLQPVSQTIR